VFSLAMVAVLVVVYCQFRGAFMHVERLTMISGHLRIEIAEDLVALRSADWLAVSVRHQASPSANRHANRKPPCTTLQSAMSEDYTGSRHVVEDRG